MPTLVLQPLPSAVIVVSAGVRVQICKVPDAIPSRSARVPPRLRRLAPAISVDDVRPLIASGAAVPVDVREQDEWDAGHVPEAVHMPIGELDAAALRDARLAGRRTATEAIPAAERERCATRS
jgi:hypothetical protein